MFDEPTLMRQDHVEKQGQRKLPRTRLQDRTSNSDTAGKTAHRTVGSAGDAAHQGEPEPSRSPYSTANPVEMRWKGTVSQDGQAAIATRFSRTRATQAASSPVRPPVSSRVSQARSARWTSADRKPVPRAADGPDRLIADLRPQPAHAHGGAPATARPPGATATAPAPRLSRVMVAMRVTALGLVTSDLVTLVLPAMVGVRGYVF